LPFAQGYERKQELLKQVGEIRVTQEELEKIALAVRERELGELAAHLADKNKCSSFIPSAQFDPIYMCYDKSVEPELADRALAEQVPVPAEKAPEQMGGVLSKIKNIFNKKPNTIGDK
jgi:hypothetical protein